MKQALLYVRVSSKEQEREGYSLDAQEKLGREYAHRHGLKIVRMWKVAESAWKKDRVQFNQLIEHSKRHPEIEHIIFDITDRMTRNDFDKMKIVSLIREFNKTIHFSRTNKIISIDFDADDEFLLDIDVAVAKKWSNDISRKAKMGMLEKAEQGKYPSACPIGYRSNNQTHEIEVDPETAPFIQTAFVEMATGNYSLSTLSEKLYRDGLRSRNGLKIIKPTLDKILNNPFYYGSFLFKGKMYRGKHESIVTKQLYDQVQFVLSGKGHSFQASKNRFAFNNLIRCGECGCKVLGEMKKRKYVYYHCTFSKGRHEGGNNYIRDDRMAMLFEDSVRRVTISKEKVEWVKNALAESKINQGRTQEQKLSALLKQKTKLETRLSRLYDLRVDDVIDVVAFDRKKNDYESQLADIDIAIKQSNKINPNYLEDGCKILELSNRLFPLYLRSDAEDKARILRLIASNYVLNGQTISATYVKPFSFMDKLDERIIKRG